MITLSDHLKSIYGQKIYRISLSSGCTCPNRDGSIGTGGCTFCTAGGSGEFATEIISLDDIDTQIEKAKQKVIHKLPSDIRPQEQRFIAYFQSYTNTYGDTGRLRSIYEKVIRRDDIAVLSLGTRPDCIDEEKLQMIIKLDHIKPVWIELGLQTANDHTAERIHRGYPTSVFDDCFRRLKSADIEVIAHVIFGLPGESRDDMLATIRHLAFLSPPLDGIKIQMLNILEGSFLAEEYKRHPFPQMTMEEYTDLVAEAVSILPDTTVIHRMTGDGPRNLLISPKWVTDKKRVMNMLRRKVAYVSADT